MNQQEIFDTVARHLFKQGHQAMLPDKDVCAYRSNGDRCAIGCLIPDEDYDEVMEERDFLQLIDGYKYGLYNLPDFLVEDSNFDLLVDLQRAHDNEGNWRDPLMRTALRDVAEKFDLDASVLDGLHLPS